MFNFIKNLFSPKPAQLVQEVPEYVKHINWPEAIKNFEEVETPVEPAPQKPKRVRKSRAKAKTDPVAETSPEVVVVATTETAPKPKKKVVETPVSE